MCVSLLGQHFQYYYYYCTGLGHSNICIRFPPRTGFVQQLSSRCTQHHPPDHAPVALPLMGHSCACSSCACVTAHVLRQLADSNTYPSYCYRLSHNRFTATRARFACSISPGTWNPYVGERRASRQVTAPRDAIMNLFQESEKSGGVERGALRLSDRSRELKHFCRRLYTLNTSYTDAIPRLTELNE